MSELQLGLIGIGAAVLVAVIAYNKWQESKLNRRGDEFFGSRHQDVLLAGDAADARTRRTAGRADEQEAESDDSVEHTLGDVDAAAPSESAQPILDEAVDFIIDIECDEEVGGDAVASAIANHISPGSHPIYWEGLNSTSAGEAWEPGEERGRYETIRLGLQLAARVGAASDLDLASFCAGAQEMAAELGGVAEFDDLDRGRARAEALDRFCADVDVQLRFNLTGSLSSRRVCAFGEANGCVPEPDGRLHCRDDSGVELFALATSDGESFDARSDAALKGVALLLDVPRAPAGPETFRRFVEFARRMARELGATLVDDNRKPLTDAGIASIGRELDAIHRRMAAYGIAAGSRLAQRLFA